MDEGEGLQESCRHEENCRGKVGSIDEQEGVACDIVLNLLRVTDIGVPNEHEGDGEHHIDNGKCLDSTEDFHIFQVILIEILGFRCLSKSIWLHVEFVDVPHC